MRRHQLALGLLAVSLAACQPAGHQFTSADSLAIDSMRVKWMDSYNAGKFDDIVALYTDNAVVQPSDAAPATNHTAIKASIEAMKAMGPARLHIAPATSFVHSGDMASAAGPFHLMVDSAHTLTGHYLVVFQRQADGKWMSVQDASGMDAPMPAAPAAPAPRGRH